MYTTTFHMMIDTFCNAYDASVTSGHRTMARNLLVGGATNSQHLRYKAVDVVLDDWSRKDAAIDWLQRIGLFIIDEVATKNHLHIDDRNNVEL